MKQIIYCYITPYTDTAFKITNLCYLQFPKVRDLHLISLDLLLSDRFPLLGLQKSLQMVTEAMKSEEGYFLAGKG